MAFQSSSEGVIFRRFITGIGVGIEIVTIDGYVTELVPQHMRGRAMVFNQMVMFAAAPVAAILSHWLVPTTLFGIEGWRWVVLIGCAGAVVVWIIRRAVPESPRWLAQKGRISEAEKVVQAIEAKVVRDTGQPLPVPAPAIELPPHEKATLAELWTPPYRSRLIMLVIFNICQAMGY